MGGRPSKFSDEMEAKAREYVNTYQQEGDEVPTVAGLAGLLGVAKSTVYKWGDEHESFSDTLEALQSKQEQVLISKGLNSKFNSTITKLMLANHGYSDKQQVTHGSNSDSVPVFEIAMVKPRES